MFSPTDHPALLFLLSLLTLWIAVRIGSFARRLHNQSSDQSPEGLDVVLTATLTLLGLIIAFSFSMAISRYDQRKTYEESEANAIGTEYLRADMLATNDAARTRLLLKNYLAQRILYYTIRDAGQLREIELHSARLQQDLWSQVRAPNDVEPAALHGLVIIGMNDVLNSQGYSQAAWWNRIPFGAWALMSLIAVCGNVLLGYSMYHARWRSVLMAVLPFVISIAFFLIADIDSPRGGIIHVRPQNLLSLSDSLSDQGTH